MVFTVDGFIDTVCEDGPKIAIVGLAAYVAYKIYTDYKDRDMSNEEKAAKKKVKDNRPDWLKWAQEGWGNWGYG